MIPRKEWIGMLARMASPVDPVKATQAMLHYVPLLSDMPDEAFNAASLEAVAMAPRRLHIPDLREVKEPLAAWWRENKPRPRAIAAPVVADEQPEVSAEERAAVAARLRAFLSEMAPKEPERPKVRAHLIPEEVLAEARARLMKRRAG